MIFTSLTCWLHSCMVFVILIVQGYQTKADVTEFLAIPQEDANFCSLDPIVKTTLTYSLLLCGIICSTLSDFGQCSAYVINKEQKTCECGMAACSNPNGGNSNQSVHVNLECTSKFVSLLLV